VNYIGIDLHKKHCQICVLSSDGKVVLEQRTPTSGPNLVDLLGVYLPARVIIEASTLSEYIARALENAGHQVIVADPNFAPMYSTRSKKIKTDKRDARTLAEAALRGTYRLSHRISDEQRRWRCHLNARQTMVQTRTQYICLIRAQLSGYGIQVPSGSAEHFAHRVRALHLVPAPLAPVEPLLRLLDALGSEIEQLEQLLCEQLQQDERAAALATMPSIGPITALTLVATLDDAGRFDNTRQVAAYLGLVPSEHSSGEKQHRGRITKAGSARARSLLVQAAHSILRLKKPETRTLWQWAFAIEQRRNRKVAVVALARRLSGILWAMMRDKSAFIPAPPEPAHQGVQEVPTLAA